MLEAATVAEIVGNINSSYQSAFEIQENDFLNAMDEMDYLLSSTKAELQSLKGKVTTAATTELRDSIDNSIDTFSNTVANAISDAVGSVAPGFTYSPTGIATYSMMPGYVMFSGPGISGYTWPSGWWASVDEVVPLTPSGAAEGMLTRRWMGGNNGPSYLFYSFTPAASATGTKLTFNGMHNFTNQLMDFGASVIGTGFSFAAGTQMSGVLPTMITMNASLWSETRTFTGSYAKTMNNPPALRGTYEQTFGVAGGQARGRADLWDDEFGTGGLAALKYENGSNNIGIVAIHNDPTNGPSYDGITSVWCLETPIPLVYAHGSTGMDLVGGSVTVVSENWISYTSEVTGTHWKKLNLRLGVGLGTVIGNEEIANQALFQTWIIFGQ